VIVLGKSFGVPPSGGKSSMNSNFEFIELLPPEGGTPNAFSSFQGVALRHAKLLGNRQGDFLGSTPFVKS
jgi:hypothetical protein